MDARASARSREGHAASAGVADKWVLIQENTFRNWVNEQLRSKNLAVTDFEKDFDNGVKLCALIAVLQGKSPGRVIQNPRNPHQELENVSLALSAIANDNIRLVNIGSDDVRTGNKKLIMGLIWHLILRYQIGKSKIPPKKLMLAWLKAVITECHITNFTTDWNDGVALHALIDYCRPGLCPNWRQLGRNDRLENCRHAMNLAKEQFDVPMVVRPEDLSSSDLDELSGMTYLSYFMKVDSPGYHATLRNTNRLLRNRSFSNFTTDWNDGQLLADLVRSIGGTPRPLTGDPRTDTQSGIDAALALGIEPVLTAQEMIDPEVDHIGNMAYSAYFTHFKPMKGGANKVLITSLPKSSYVGQETNFSVRLDDDDASPGDVRAEVKGSDSTITVSFNWSGKVAQCSFVPTETGHHKLNVYCENQLISECPASFRVNADRSKIVFHGIDKCAVGELKELKVNAREAGGGDIQIETRSPNGRVQNLSSIPRNGNYLANFNPSEVGVWQVSVCHEGEHITGSPYHITVYDPTAVQVYGLEGGTVGTGLTFHADATRAGEGSLTCKVSNEAHTVASHIVEEKDGLYKIDFTPQGAGTYKIHVYFNGTEVRGSPYAMDILDSSNVTVSGDGLSLVPVNKTAHFEVNMQGSTKGTVEVEITSPNGRIVPNKRIKDGNEYRVEYVPVEVGDHNIEIKYGNHEISGSPFAAKAYDTSAIKVTPPKDGVVGEQINFWIDVSKAGEGQLEIMVNGGNIPNTVSNDGHGKYKMTFVPEQAGTQTVEIIFNKESHPESPLTCQAVDLSGASVRSLETEHPCNIATSFYIHSVSGNTNLPVNVEVLAPNGDRLLADVYPKSGGDYKVEWTPRSPGRHIVDVQYNGRQVDGSPYYVNVFDLKMIRVDNFRHGVVGDLAGFSVDFSQAGTLEQDIRIVSPSGSDVAYDTRSLGHMWQDVTYEPEEPGTFKIYITYAGFQLPGCPFKQEISDGGLPTASGDGLYFGQENKTSTFHVDVGRRKGNLQVAVDGPNSIAKCNVDPQSDGSYTISYIPVETGMFDVSVKWNGDEIPGSPYHPRIVDPSKVKIIGGWNQFYDGNERIGLIVGEVKVLPFETSEAGPGKLRVDVAGPGGKISSHVEEQSGGRTLVKFTPEEEGNHYVHLFWSDLPLPNSPYLGYAVPITMDANKVILTGRGLKEAIVREEAEFIIDGSQAGKGSPEVTLSGVRAEVSVKVTSLGNGRFRCNYVPVVPGAYLLHISWDGRQLRGSPYKVNIIGAFYPNKVSVSGEGLKGGLLGREMNILIDTRRAGPGELTAHCMGPHQVALCELEDRRDGTFRLGIRPQEPGRHVLQIKYGGEHVQGSPFVFKVVQQPDASRVRITGPGVEHGILANFQSRFIVETRGAGAGQLTVRIRGPKGGFQVEMYRDSQRDRTILCRYDPVETGLYIISVKWSGVDVPGSPFHVHLVDTQQELEQVYNDPSYSAPLHSVKPSFRAPQPINYAQWREEL